MPKLSHSYVLSYHIGPDAFDAMYVAVVDDIIKKLNEAGRKGERLSWIQGEFIPGETFPLDIMFGPGTHYYIEAHCEILEVTMNEGSKNHG